MLILNPRSVSFGAQEWPNILAVTIDRAPRATAEEFTDLGPFATFADVPEISTRLTVTQELSTDDLAGPGPGDRATLRFDASSTALDGPRRRLSTDAVVLSIQHELSLKRGALRTITLAALSPDGASDPISFTQP